MQEQGAASMLPIMPGARVPRPPSAPQPDRRTRPRPGSNRGGRQPADRLVIHHDVEEHGGLKIGGRLSPVAKSGDERMFFEGPESSRSRPGSMEGRDVYTGSDHFQAQTAAGQRLAKEARQIVAARRGLQDKADFSARANEQGWDMLCAERYSNAVELFSIGLGLCPREPSLLANRAAALLELKR